MNNRGFEKLQEEFNRNPLQTIAIGSLAAGALAKLISAVSQARRDSTWNREVARRERMEYRNRGRR